MKKIELTIKPFRIEELREALLDRGFDAMTVSEIRRFPSSITHPPLPHIESELREFPLDTDFDPRLKVEIVVPDERLETAIAVIKASSCTRAPVFVQDITDVIRIRTSERGPLAV